MSSNCKELLSFQISGNKQTMERLSADKGGKLWFRRDGERRKRISEKSALEWIATAFDHYDGEINIPGLSDFVKLVARGI